MTIPTAIHPRKPAMGGCSARVQRRISIESGLAHECNEARTGKGSGLAHRRHFHLFPAHALHVDLEDLAEPGRVPFWDQAFGCAATCKLRHRTSDARVALFRSHMTHDVAHSHAQLACRIVAAVAAAEHQALRICTVLHLASRIKENQHAALFREVGR